MSACYLPWCGRGRHAGSHGPAPAPRQQWACAPLRCYCTTFVCAAAGLRPVTMRVGDAADLARATARAAHEAAVARSAVSP